MQTGLTASDVLSLTKDHDDGFGGVGLIILLFIFLIALFGGGFGGYNRGFGSYTDSEIQRGFDTNEITRKLDGINYGICDSTFALNNTVQNGNFQTQLGLNNLGSQMQNCCCGIERSIDGVNYNNAKNTCEIVNAIRTDGEMTRNLITQNTIQGLRDELDQARCALNTQGQSRYILDSIGRYVTNPPCPNNNYYGFGCSCNSLY